MGYPVEALKYDGTSDNRRWVCIYVWCASLRRFRCYLGVITGGALVILVPVALVAGDARDTADWIWYVMLFIAGVGALASGTARLREPPE